MCRQFKIVSKIPTKLISGIFSAINKFFKISNETISWNKATILCDDAWDSTAQHPTLPLHTHNIKYLKYLGISVYPRLPELYDYIGSVFQ